MFDRLKRLIYRPDFFRESTLTLNQGMTFYSLAVLVLVVGIIATLLPGALRTLGSMRSGEWDAQRVLVTSLYPDGLVVSVTDGVIATNQPNPVVVPVPKEWEPVRGDCFTVRCQESKASWPINLIAIDTDRAVSTESFARYESVVVVGKNDVGFRNPERGETRIFNLRDSGFRETFIIDEDLVASWVDRGFVFARGAVIALFAMAPAFTYLGLWIGYLIYSLFGAIIVMLAAYIQGHTLRYGRAYLSTLYLYPVPFAFSFLMSLSHSHIPFVFTLVLFGIAFVIFPKAVDSEPASDAKADGK
ncbi:MAG: DUF1189 family protein [Candidatus Moraniibacteriota bacterium]